MHLNFRHSNGQATTKIIIRYERLGTAGEGKEIDTSWLTLSDLVFFITLHSPKRGIRLRRKSFKDRECLILFNTNMCIIKMVYVCHPIVSEEIHNHLVFLILILSGSYTFSLPYMRELFSLISYSQTLILLAGLSRFNYFPAFHILIIFLSPCFLLPFLFLIPVFQEGPKTSLSAHNTPGFLLPSFSSTHYPL